MKITVVTWNTPERHEQFMKAAHPDMDVSVVADSASDEEKIAACRDAEAIILACPTISPEVLRHCPDVKLLQGILAGYDRLDLEAIGALGIPYANNGGSNANPVAEHALGLTLALGRGIVRQARNARERRWNQGLRDVRTWELTGKRVGILGLGPIGRTFARLLTGFGCDTVYYKTAPAPPEVEAQIHARYMPLDELLSTSDVVSIHLALTPATRGLIGEREIGLMKPTALLINTARGDIVDEAALYRALSEGRLAGAGLDVLEKEPTPDDNPLLDLDNVIITPHQSGISAESAGRSATFAFANVRRAILGEPIQSQIWPRV